MANNGSGDFPQIFGAFFKREPPKRSPVQQRMDLAFEEVAKIFQLLPAAHATTPALAIAALAEMETYLLRSADYLRQAQAALRLDPVEALTPVPVVKKEVAP